MHSNLSVGLTNRIHDFVAPSASCYRAVTERLPLFRSCDGDGNAENPESRYLKCGHMRKKYHEMLMGGELSQWGIDVRSRC
jgi:hypothetical protein